MPQSLPRHAVVPSRSRNSNGNSTRGVADAAGGEGEVAHDHLVQRPLLRVRMGHLRGDTWPWEPVGTSSPSVGASSLVGVVSAGVRGPSSLAAALGPAYGDVVAACCLRY